MDILNLVGDMRAGLVSLTLGQVGHCLNFKLLLCGRSVQCPGNMCFRMITALISVVLSFHSMLAEIPDCCCGRRS